MSNKMALDALTDMLSGWRYIRSTHGDLYGVGWDRAEEKAVAAIAALQAEPQGWMPIETAPKDGTRILVCNKADYVYPARWQGVESGKPADWPQGWRDDVMFVAADGIVSWMQLPATPPKD